MKKITIKKIVVGSLLTLFAGMTTAQNGLEGIIVEKYYVADANDNANSIGNLPIGAVTYRVFVDMLPGYKFQALYGVTGHAMTIQTSTTFFNNEDRGDVVPDGIAVGYLNDN